MSFKNPSSLDEAFDPGEIRADIVESHVIESSVTETAVRETGIVEIGVMEIGVMEAGVMETGVIEPISGNHRNDEGTAMQTLASSYSEVEVGASTPSSAMVLQLPWDVLKTATHDYQPACLEVTLPNLSTLESVEKRVAEKRVAEKQIAEKQIAETTGAIAALVALLHRYAQPEQVVLTVNRLSDAPVLGALHRASLQVTIAPETSGDQLMAHVANQLARQSPSRSTDGLDATLASNVSFTQLAADHGLPGEALIHAQMQPSASETPDLHWFLEPTETQWRGVVIYNASLFHASTVERMVGHLTMLLQGMQAEGDRPITTLPLLTPAEVEQQLGAWSSPTAAYPSVPIFHAVEAHAARQPGAIAPPVFCLARD